MQTKPIQTKEGVVLKCPLCKSPELSPTELEAGLRFFHCPQCRGNWVRGTEYFKWLEQHGPNLPERSGQAGGLSLAEPGNYLDCPECRFRLVKYLVGHGYSFTIDHCEGCKGVWLDRNEWEALKERNLHDDLNSMVTSFWQDAAEKEARKKRLEHIYISRFGAADYTEIARVRTWLATRPNRQDLLAFLTDKDPFDV
ncbi:MAG TPA: zf-TFIIB domain-containing protein [Pyrinomonadaceae bacterium]|jgi:Zn-finger nucleic acid-binding protein|nr:zf-TFIIB domain-containing protein [Pyrinomonadaceae bacterium]